LQSIYDQTLSKADYEVIVVDNNSTDDTTIVVESFKSFGNLRYLTEPRQGLSYARNTGWENALGRYVAYIDDDALAAPDWLKVAYDLIHSIQPSPDCLGGPIYPFYTSPKPSWFKDEYEIRRDWAEPRYLTRGNSFSGSNCIWTRASLQLIQGFDVKAGVTGNKLSLGSETSAFDRLWQAKADPQLYFSPALMVRHWVPNFKMTVFYRLKRNFAMGQYRAKMYKYRARHGKTEQFFLKLFETLKLSLRALIRVRLFPHWQNWVFEEWSKVLLTGGEAIGLLGIFINMKQNNQ